MLRTIIALGLGAATAALLAGCGNSSGASGLSTASILGEAPASASGDRPGVNRNDPMARPIQVAWTSARAEKCGFNFNPQSLKANYLAAERQGGADAARLASAEKVYDQTALKVKASIGSADQYCTDRKSTEIKADLTRHLAGDFEPKFPEEKQASGGLFSFDSTAKEDTFNAKTIFQDIQDKKNGVRREKSE